MCLNLTTRQTLAALAGFAVVLAASGFVLEYGFHVLPCKMCWWQRYAHWAIFALAALGLTNGRAAKPALYGIVVAASAGLTIAAWQFAAQHGWLPFPATCVSDPTQAFAAADDLLAAMNQTKIVPCDKENFKLLGLSLAGWNIPAMLLATSLAINGLKNRA